MRFRGGMLLVLCLTAAIAVGAVRYWVESDNCSGCGDCSRVCPVDAIEMVDGKSSIDPVKCIGCGLCQGVCTYDAIH